MPKYIIRLDSTRRKEVCLFCKYSVVRTLDLGGIYPTEDNP